MKKTVRIFFEIFASAFLIAMLISISFMLALKQSALPLNEIRNDFLFALFIACVQLIWVGSDQSNKTYLIRTVIHFAVLLTGCTLLMLWFGWLPWGPYLITYYVIFIAVYIIIWIIVWKLNRKKWKEMNQSLSEFKRKNRE